MGSQSDGSSDMMHARVTAKPVVRVLLCIVAVFVLTAELYIVPLRHRPLSAVLIFLFLVLIVSCFWGFRFALFVSLLAALGFSWLLPPVGHFSLTDSRDTFALVAFLVIGITTSHLSDRVRREALSAKQAEGAARRSEERFREVIEMMPAMAWSVLPDGSNAFLNKQWAEYTGLSEEQTTDPGWRSTVFHPEDASGHREKWRQFLATGQPFEHEVRLRRIADGQYRWFLVRGVPLHDEHGNVLKWYGIATDIEDRKRAEEALRASEHNLTLIINTIPALSWSARPDGSADFFNQHYLDFVGLSAEQVQDWGWTVALHPDDLSGLTRTWQSIMASGKAGEAEARLRRFDGEYRWFLFRANPLCDEFGCIVKWFGLNTDITERKRAEDLLTGEKRILEMLARGEPLPQILDGMCRFVEEQVSGSLSSILLVDGDRLRHGGAPSLPKDYTDVVDGAAIGPSAGSCGTAVYRREQVIVEDIATDPLWADYREMALPHSLRACWSTPVFSSRGEVIATFAIYYREPRSPSQRDQETLEQITHLAGVAIERKQTQDALRRNEAYLAEAQKLSKTGSWAWDPHNDKMLYCSEEIYRIYGVDPQEPMPSIGLFLQRVHPEDRSRLSAEGVSTYRNRLIAESVRGSHSKIYATEFRLLLPDGTITHVLSMRRPVLDGAGNLVEVIGTIVDVTERKSAELALQRSEAYLAEAQKLTHTGSWARNVRTGVHFWSQETFRIFDYDPEKVTPTWDLVVERVHPEDRSEAERRVDRESTQKEWADFESDFRIVLPDGTIKHLHAISRRVIDESGEISEVVGTVMDVTERKRAEEKLRHSEEALLEAQRLSHMGSWKHDIASGVFVVSPEIYRIFGAQPDEDTSNVDFWFGRHHPEDRQRIRGFFERSEREKTDFEADYRIVLLDGTIKHLRTVAHPVLKQSGELVEMIGTTIDVTEHKRGEEERERLRQLEADLAHMNRVTMLGELASSLAHELNQPIAAAITSANACLRWLAHNPPDMERARAAATRIENDGSRAAEIIRRLRAFYKTGAPPKRESVDLNQVVAEILALLREEADRNSISLRTELASQLPQIMADRVQLQQVLMNLLLNGIEAMTGGAGELIIRSQNAENGLLLISVSDTGVGLPSEKPEQLFNAFYTTKPQGTGMGLAISRSIIEAHGGRLWATANAERGATFHFTMPALAEVQR
jgi:PAS domain S-box-containing protein